MKASSANCSDKAPWFENRCAPISRDFGNVLHHGDSPPLMFSLYRHVIALFAMLPFASAETTFHCESDSLLRGNIPAAILD